MIKHIKLFIIGCLAISLAGCFLSVNQEASSGTLAKSSIHQQKLANGDAVSIGYVVPEDQWDCSPVSSSSYNWMMAETKGMMYINGVHGYLEKEAIDFANKNYLKTNYILIKIPTQVGVNGLDLSSTSNATVLYFFCKTMPTRSS